MVCVCVFICVGTCVYTYGGPEVDDRMSPSIALPLNSPRQSPSVKPKAHHYDWSQEPALPRDSHFCILSLESQAGPHAYPACPWALHSHWSLTHTSQQREATEYSKRGTHKGIPFSHKRSDMDGTCIMLSKINWAQKGKYLMTSLLCGI